MNTTDKVQLLQQFDAWKTAFEAEDVDWVMSFYAPGDELVAFDLMPPIQLVGEKMWRDNWVNFFNQFEGNPVLETRVLKTYGSGDIAFIYGFTRLTGSMQGQPLDMWARQTNCFRKIGDDWLIVHDHVSFPTDFATGRSLTDLQP